MKTKKRFSIGIQATALVFLMSLLLIGCGDEQQRGVPPLHSNPPLPPTLVSVDNLNGAAIIHFEAPVQYDIMAITATYELNGVERVVRASMFSNTLKVEGFGATGDFTVWLRTVDTSRNESEPVAVTVSPLTPPVELIFETLTTVTTFGGIAVFWENIFENNIIVSVQAQDEFGYWNSVQSFFSSEMYGRGTVRGMDPVETNFRIVVRDRWDNFSDVYAVTTTPWAEERLNPVHFRTVTPLPNDAPQLGAWAINRIWNGNTTTQNDNAWHSQENLADQDWFITFDLGQLANLSRFRLWQRPGFFFTHNNLRRYSLYGATEITLDMRQSGCRDGWTHLVDVVSHRPSGPFNLAQLSPLSAEDNEFARAGEEIEFPLGVPSVRYIRIFLQESWGGGRTYQIQEIHFWGEVLEIFN